VLFEHEVIDFQWACSFLAGVYSGKGFNRLGYPKLPLRAVTKLKNSSNSTTNKIILINFLFTVACATNWKLSRKKNKILKQFVFLSNWFLTWQWQHKRKEEEKKSYTMFTIKLLPTFSSSISPWYWCLFILLSKKKYHHTCAYIRLKKSFRKKSLYYSRWWQWWWCFAYDMNCQ